MKKCKELMKSVEIQMKLCSKSERRWFWSAFVVLVFYVEFVIFAQNTVLGYIDSPVLNVLQAAAAIPLCFILLLAISRWKISGEDQRAGDRAKLRKRILFILVVWALTFSVFLLCQLARWPGSFSSDSIDQYGQAYYGDYNNWHPTLHTWLFFGFPLQIFHEPWGIVLFQILWFSLAVTYLFYVLYVKGCPSLFLVFGWLYIVANPNTLYIMMYPWKDSALTIFATLLFAQLVQIYLTKGIWLKKWYNFTSFTIFAFLTLEMRYNAMLLVIPVFVLLFCYIKSERVVLSAFMVLLIHFFLYGPVFTLMNVKLPTNRQEETMGLPMAILSDIFVQDREALNEDARTFMETLATKEMWESYGNGNFNNIRYSVDWSLIEKAGYQRVLWYAADAVMARPALAWKAFCMATGQVWETDSGNGWHISNGIAENSYGISYHGNELLRVVFSTYAKLVSAHLTKYIFRYAGGISLVLLFLAVGNLGGGNLHRSLLILAPATYNFGTMLLLGGPDVRHFHFNFVIVVPLIYILLRRRETPDYDGNKALVTK